MANTFPSIAPLDDAEADGLLSQLHPVKYDLKSRPGRRLMGFVAESTPASLVVDSQGFVEAKGVDLMGIVATLVGVIRAQRNAFTQLEARVAQLERGRVTP
jgi:hypothetical protein